MPVVIACPTCLSKIRAPETALGRQVKCPQCRSPFVALEPVSSERLATPVPSGSTESFDDEPLPTVLPSSTPEFAPPAELVPPLPVQPLPPPPGTLGDYLLFRKLLTPHIMPGVFYFGSLLILLEGLATLAWAGFVLTNENQLLLGVGLLLVSLVGTVVALVFWRVTCEVLIVLFRIHDLLRDRPVTR